MFPSNTSTVHRVFRILHRSELQPTLQLESLRLLYKVWFASLLKHGLSIFIESLTLSYFADPSDQFTHYSVHGDSGAFPEAVCSC